MRKKTQTRYTPWVYTEGRMGWDKNPMGIKAYRIWIETDGRSWWQRHEWLYQDGKTSIDEWIDSAIHKFPAHYIEITDDNLDG